MRILGSELIYWLIFIVSLLGLSLIFKIYIASVKQYRLENTFRVLEFLRRNISETQIATFVKLYQANNELNGARYNEFKFSNERLDKIETMFEEGGSGNGDIYNLIVTFNIMVDSLKETEERIIWYEYGQIMDKIYSWTGYLDSNINRTENVAFYSDFNNYMKRNRLNILSVPFKYYTYAES